jgi:hypothetical protein
LHDAPPVVYDSHINRQPNDYASLDYLTCNDLPGQSEIQAAIEAIETAAA